MEDEVYMSRRGPKLDRKAGWTECGCHTASYPQRYPLIEAYALHDAVCCSLSS